MLKLRLYLHQSYLATCLQLMIGGTAGQATLFDICIKFNIQSDEKKGLYELIISYQCYFLKNMLFGNVYHALEISCLGDS